LFEKRFFPHVRQCNNCGLKEINEIEMRVRKLNRNFISGAGSQEINGVEIYRKFGFYENRV